MSVQFGKCNFDGASVDRKEMDRLSSSLAAYGPDTEGFFHNDNVGIIHRAFHTTKESQNEIQPFMLASGAVITWDGRLDNREEISRRLGNNHLDVSTDVSIVGAAYERWGRACFGTLMGDWACSVWDAKDRVLLLAKDFMGTRHLYYRVEGQGVSWCTVLDPLVLFNGNSLAIEERYVAGWLSSFPEADLTPYLGIRSVPASCFVCITPGSLTTNKYWDFSPGKSIRYGTDEEYEQHFQSVFFESVRRRLRCDRPVLAELSGGLDSSSIVCAADNILAEGLAEASRLDTVSYYDDAEPNWNERPYFTKVEEQRGRTGCHIDAGTGQPLAFEVQGNHFAATPNSSSRTTEAGRQLASHIVSGGYRTILSGIGGDEVLGGVPSPVPELLDLLRTAKFSKLSQRLLAWSLTQRKPWFHMLFEAVKEFLPANLFGAPKHLHPAPWLDDDFVRRHRPAIAGRRSRLKLSSSRPSFQQNLSTLDDLRRQLACEPLSSEPPIEKSYPYLDRDLLEFLYAIPREQLVRPGQRRSLMRRALTGVVPDEILNRPRKAYVVRSPMRMASSEWSTPSIMESALVSAEIGIVNTKSLLAFMQEVRIEQGPFAMIAFLRTLSLEVWLRDLRARGVVLSAGHSRRIISGTVVDSRSGCH